MEIGVGVPLVVNFCLQAVTYQEALKVTASASYQQKSPFEMRSGAQMPVWIRVGKLMTFTGVAYLQAGTQLQGK